MNRGTRAYRRILLGSIKTPSDKVEVAFFSYPRYNAGDIFVRKPRAGRGLLLRFSAESRLLKRLVIPELLWEDKKLSFPRVSIGNFLIITYSQKNGRSPGATIGDDSFL